MKMYEENTTVGNTTRTTRQSTSVNFLLFIFTI